MKLELLLEDGTTMTVEGVVSFKGIEEQVTYQEHQAAKVTKRPLEDRWFEVNPQAINQSLFQNKRNDARQEENRKLILEAFAEVKNKPEKYDKKFKTMMPKKTWSCKKSKEELEQLACELGDHNADWVEQALEWAQRITNGESWEDVCNNADRAKWYRLVIWKNGFGRLVGGSRILHKSYPASYVDNSNYLSFCKIDDCVPLVVSYEK